VPCERNVAIFASFGTLVSLICCDAWSVFFAARPRLYCGYEALFAKSQALPRLVVLKLCSISGIYNVGVEVAMRYLTRRWSLLLALLRRIDLEKQIIWKLWESKNS
jgi:hypothetical protein